MLIRKSDFYSLKFNKMTLSYFYIPVLFHSLELLVSSVLMLKLEAFLFLIETLHVRSFILIHAQHTWVLMPTFQLVAEDGFSVPLVPLSPVVLRGPRCPPFLFSETAGEPAWPSRPPSPGIVSPCLLWGFTFSTRSSKTSRM